MRFSTKDPLSMKDPRAPRHLILQDHGKGAGFYVLMRASR